MRGRGYGNVGGGPRLPEGSGGLVAGAVVAIVVVAVLVVLLSKACSGGASSSALVDCSKKAPAPPAGFAYASKYCLTGSKLAGKQDSVTGVPLTDRSSTHGLTLYGYSGGTWTPIAPVQVSADGSTGDVTTLVLMPKAFAVLKRSAGGMAVLGTVPKGQQPSTEAAQVLSALTPAVYSPAADGSISGGPATVQPNAGYGTIPVVAFAPTDANGSQAVATILADPAKITAHVNAIMAEVTKNNYDGIEIDYPTVDSGLKSGYSQLIQALGTQLHNQKKQLIVRAPLPRKEGSNWNVFAYDWPALAKSADLLVMAAERDQSIYRTRVPDAVRYLAGQVDPKKLVLEVSPYAEDRSDQGVVTTLSTAAALAIAGQITVRDPQNVYVNTDVPVAADNINRETGSGPQWTPQGVVSFNYTKGAEQHTVWLENRYSAGYKLEIAQLFHLGGIAVDNATGDPTLADIWPAVAQYVSTGAPTLEQPNPQTLKPEWLADGKPIADAGNRAAITWHTPSSSGQHELELIVSEGTMRVQTATKVNVKAGTPPPGSGVSPVPSATGPARGAPTVRATPTVSGR